MKVVNYLDVTWFLSTLSKTKRQNTLHSHSVRSPTIYNQATTMVHQKGLIIVIIIKRYILWNNTILWATSRQRGYNEKLTYQQQGENNKNSGKIREHNIIYFNPPYSISLNSNIGKYFFGLPSKHFPTGRKLRKIFNKNNLKLSYSCMAYLKAKIDGHHKKYSKTHHLQKHNYTTVWKKKLSNVRSLINIDSKLTINKKYVKNYTRYTTLKNHSLGFTLERMTLL